MKLTNLVFRKAIIAAIFEFHAMQKYINLIALLQKLISKEHVVGSVEFPDWLNLKNILKSIPWQSFVIIGLCSHLMRIISKYAGNIKKTEV